MEHDAGELRVCMNVLMGQIGIDYSKLTKKEQMTLLRQLAGMANNLNQLARKANSAGYVQAAAECTALIEKIDTLIDQINE